jgi:hypothetical protein
MAAPNTVTSRYGVGPLTGYPTMRVGSVYGRTPPTIWYVHDRFLFSEVVAVFRFEGQARKHAFELNAEERAWEKGG